MMVMSQIRVSRSILFLATVMAVAVAASPVDAATFSADATSSISSANLTGNSTASFTASNAPPPDGATVMGPVTSGTGTVGTLSSTNSTGFGTQSASVAGSALGPPDSFASAGVEVHDFVEVFNNNGGSGAAVLTFDFTYEASAAFSADPGDEAAAHYNFHISGADDEEGEQLAVSIGGGPFVDMDDFEVDDFLLASLGDSGASVGPTTVSVRYTAEPFAVGGADGEYAFSIFTRADGAAASPALAVPEPASVSLWLLIAALVTGFGYYRWRR